jgi:retron-type reverse transcriptase
MADWYSIARLEQAWKYARNEMRDDFIFDIIDHEDIKFNKDRVLKTLNTQLMTGQYHPVPLLQIDVPKNDYSVRPGSTIAFIDLIVLYAIVQQLAHDLDKRLADSAYAYRLNKSSKDTLFSAREEPTEAKQGEAEPAEDEINQSEERGEDITFPYNWFRNWLAFHKASLEAADTYQYVAVTDITAFFENISIELLFDRVRGLLSENHRDLVDRLYELVRYWDWSSASAKIRGQGLPQGNNVSSFLSNIYLIDLDDAMLQVVRGDVKKYYRYVDDVKIYTSSYEEAQRALLELERVLRKLGLNVQSVKTKIVSADSVFDPDVTEWEQLLVDDNDEKIDNAERFFNEVFDIADESALHKWERIYRRALTILGQASNNSAISIALETFLDNPSNRLVVKNFSYLRQFVTERQYESKIFERLINNGYLFDYHRAYLFRLAAYSRGEHEDFRQYALAHVTDSTNNWFSRIAALLFLSTHHLTGSELADISRILDADSNPQVLRAAYVNLAQHSGNEFRTILDSLSFFNAPHQDYLRRYFSRLSKDRDLAIQICRNIDGASLNAPGFVSQLHKLDIVKSNSDCRRDFRRTIDRKIQDCGSTWPRLKTRLEGIRDTFIENQ